MRYLNRSYLTFYRSLASEPDLLAWAIQFKKDCAESSFSIEMKDVADDVESDIRSLVQKQSDVLIFLILVWQYDLERYGSDGEIFDFFDNAQGLLLQALDLAPSARELVVEELQNPQVYAGAVKRLMQRPISLDATPSVECPFSADDLLCKSLDQFVSRIEWKKKIQE
ncbi:MAG: hypothetical protein ACRCXD_15025 [Luteolibacter sp.]